MAIPVLEFDESNTSGQTVTANISSIVFASVDENSSTSNLAVNNPVAAGQRSYEKWIRMKVTTASTNSLSGFGVYFTSGNITDGGGGANITGYYGTNNAYTTPTNSASSAATSLTSSDTSSPGTSFTAPANSSGSYSGYITLQVSVASGAAGGNATFPSNWMNCGYTYS
jgi:hypothetical protein